MSFLESEVKSLLRCEAKSFLGCEAKSFLRFKDLRSETQAC